MIERFDKEPHMGSTPATGPGPLSPKYQPKPLKPVPTSEPQDPLEQDEEFEEDELAEQAGV
jgi:hypothetical protein